MYRVKVIVKYTNDELQLEVNRFLNKIGDKFVSSSLSLSADPSYVLYSAMITYKDF